MKTMINKDVLWRHKVEKFTKLQNEMKELVSQQFAGDIVDSSCRFGLIISPLRLIVNYTHEN